MNDHDCDWRCWLRVRLPFWLLDLPPVLRELRSDLGVLAYHVTLPALRYRLRARKFTRHLKAKT